MATCGKCGKVVGCGCQLKQDANGLAVCPECYAGSSVKEEPKQDVKIINSKPLDSIKVIINKVTGTIVRNN